MIKRIMPLNKKLWDVGEGYGYVLCVCCEKLCTHGGQRRISEVFLYFSLHIPLKQRLLNLVLTILAVLTDR